MPDNFEEIIKRLRQCRQQINSSSGATGRLKTLEKIVFKAEKSLRRIHDPNSRSALTNTVGAKRKLKFNNLKRFIEKNIQLEHDIKQGKSGKSTDEDIEAAENVSSFYSSTSSETIQNHDTSTENHVPKLVKAIKGAKTEFFMGGAAATNLSPEIKSSFKSAVGVNIIHRNEHKNALHMRNKWADKYGINVSSLTKSDYLHTLEHAKDKGMISENRADSLRKIIEREQQLRSDLTLTSESMGEQAADAIMKARDEAPLLSHETKIGAGMLDRASLGYNPPRITIYEAKGGNSRLGYRTIGGIMYQQGTTTYLNELVRLDSRFSEGLRRHVMASPAADPISHAIQNGTIEVHYELVEAKPNGRIYVTPFILDETILDLPKLDKIL